jgi:YHS domain-containing protein
MTKDPVCKMEVNEKEAAATSTYKGETYYFCADGCKTDFDNEPEKYVHESGKSGHGCGCSCSS